MASIDIPAFALPVALVPDPAPNPQLGAARAAAAGWARATGMLDGRVWTEAGFEAADWGRFASLCAPDAPPATLVRITQWLVWAFYCDDYVLENFRRGNDYSGAEGFVGELGRFLGSEQLAPSNPPEAGLADLWPRTARTIPARQRGRFRDAVRGYLDGVLREMRVQAAGRPSDPVDYVEMRRRTGGGALAAELAALGAGEIGRRESFAAARALSRIVDSFADVVGLGNDLFSYDVEIHREGEVNNLVLVIEDFLDCRSQDAADIVKDLVDRRLDEFDVAVESARTQDELDATERAALARYARALQNWLSGCLAWMAESPRYTLRGAG